MVQTRLENRIGEVGGQFGAITCKVALSVNGQHSFMQLIAPGSGEALPVCRVY